VEDDPIVPDDLRTLLEREGFEVLAGARDGVEAVELAREHRPDVILLDLSLPRLDGVEAALRIREERDVPIVAVTGYSETLVERALEAGAAGYVRKPFAGGEVVTALRDAIRSHAEQAVDSRREQSRRALVRLAELLGYTEEIGVELEERAFADGKVWRIVDQAPSEEAPTGGSGHDLASPSSQPPASSG
jgi:CheY-like chemotaxis protein